MRDIVPGQVYRAFARTPEERPVIVVSREELSRGHYVVVVPCTSRRVEERKELPNCVFFASGEFGMTKDCVAQCEQITALLTEYLNIDSGPIATLDGTRMRDVIRAIGNAIGSDCEPLS